MTQSYTCSFAHFNVLKLFPCGVVSVYRQALHRDMQHTVGKDIFRSAERVRLADGRNDCFYVYMLERASVETIIRERFTVTTQCDSREILALLEYPERHTSQSVRQYDRFYFEFPE
ncbi:hypothetical protein [Bacteroides acidifaciens]|uniref:hypothetical protein n=1 Tax=Bacteroides acidifaciens TaxID=85831 RepID=UPI002623638F|nr:hypothetical protein [Bacteroides acidifaciens]